MNAARALLEKCLPVLRQFEPPCDGVRWALAQMIDAFLAQPGAMGGPWSLRMDDAGACAIVRDGRDVLHLRSGSSRNDSEGNARAVVDALNARPYSPAPGAAVVEELLRAFDAEWLKKASCNPSPRLIAAVDALRSAHGAGLTAKERAFFDAAMRRCEVYQHWSSEALAKGYESDDAAHDAMLSAYAALRTPRPPPDAKEAT